MAAHYLTTVLDTVIWWLFHGRDLGLAAEDLEETSRASKTILSLPIFPEMTREQAERVAATLIEAVGA